MSEVNKMKSGEFFNPYDPELMKARKKAREACAKYQSQPSPGHLKQVLSLLSSSGMKAYFEPGVQLDYGFNIEIGDHFYANFNCVFLDAGEIKIGNNVMIGPGAHVYTVSHPIDATQRQTKSEFAKPVVIEDNVWIGGQSVILPGARVGKNSVIGAGSVVTKDVPESVLVAGNPARIIKSI